MKKVTLNNRVVGRLELNEDVEAAIRDEDHVVQLGVLYKRDGEVVAYDLVPLPRVPAGRTPGGPPVTVDIETRTGDGVGFGWLLRAEKPVRPLCRSVETYPSRVAALRGFVDMCELLGWDNLVTEVRP